MPQNLNLDLTEILVAEIAVIDVAGTIVYSNRKWAETAKAGMLSTRNSNWNYIDECERAIQRGCADAVEILEGLRGVVRGDLPCYVANYPCPFDGLYRWFQVLISSFEVDSRRLAMIMHVDVSAMQRDSLTGLSNRAMFDAQLDLALSLAHNTGCRSGLVIIDMNNLKSINDMHGHGIGDEALKLVAAEIKKAAGPKCLCARIGGDEFGVVLPPSNDILSPHRIRALFGSGITYSIRGPRDPISISASVGIALYPDDATTAGELYKIADKSMYAQKRGLSVA